MAVEHIRFVDCLLLASLGLVCRPAPRDKRVRSATTSIEACPQRLLRIRFQPVVGEFIDLRKDSLSEPPEV